MSISPVLISSSLASFKLQVLGSLSNSSDDFDSVFASVISSAFPDSNDSSSGLLDLLIQSNGAKAAGMTAGRNMSLADPESAYKMMTFINSKDVLYKAQYSELSEMGSYVARMEEAGQGLGRITTSTGNGSIKSGLQDFVTQYNEWIQRFRSNLQDGGLLDGTQAAEISQYELEQSVKNRFLGVKDGLHGLGDLGITVDPGTQLISLDTAKLDSMLSSSKQGVVGTVQEFSANFAKAASLLNSDNNFIPNQLDNLERAIHYIGDNSDSLQAEFGAGDPAKPAGQIAKALAAYNRVYGV